MSLEKYGPPERSSGTWADEKRKGREADSSRTEGTQKKWEGGMREKRRRVIETEREDGRGEMLAELEKQREDGEWRN